MAPHALCALGALFIGTSAFAQSPTSAVAYESGSADAFREGVRTRVLPENFHTRSHSFLFTNPDELQLMTRSFSALKNFVATKVNEVCLAQGRAPRVCEKAGNVLRQEWVDRTAGEVAAREFALWFYKLDGDNWFSHEAMLKETQNYLDKDGRELFMTRGFRARGVIADFLVVEDLPIVVDFQEHTVSFWVNELED